MNCVVLGGTGYFGKNVARALRNAGAQVTIASRTPPDGGVRFDFSEPATFDALNNVDAVINCADTTRAQPDAAISHVLAQGGMFVETTDDARTLLRLIEKFRGAPTSGRLLIGLGIMPGLSNLAAAELARGRDKDARIEVAIRLNPLSGAGAGMSALSAQVISTVSKRWEAGVLITNPPVWFSPLIPFRDGDAPALRTGLPEALMLGYSTGARNTAAYLSTGSPLIEAALFGASLLFPQDAVFKPIATKAVGDVFTGVRSGLFRNLRTPLEIVAMAGRTNDLRHNGDSLNLWVSDGIDAASAAICASVQLLLETPPVPGAYLSDEALTLNPVITRMRALMPDLEVKVRREA